MGHAHRLCSNYKVLVAISHVFVKLTEFITDIYLSFKKSGSLRSLDKNSGTFMLASSCRFCLVFCLISHSMFKLRYGITQPTEKIHYKPNLFIYLERSTEILVTKKRLLNNAIYRQINLSLLLKPQSPLTQTHSN